MEKTKITVRSTFPKYMLIDVQNSATSNERVLRII